MKEDERLVSPKIYLTFIHLRLIQVRKYRTRTNSVLGGWQSFRCVLIPCILQRPSKLKIVFTFIIYLAIVKTHREMSFSPSSVHGAPFAHLHTHASYSKMIRKPSSAKKENGSSPPSSPSAIEAFGCFVNTSSQRRCNRAG